MLIIEQHKGSGTSMDFRPHESLISPDNAGGVKVLIPKNVELAIKDELNKGNSNTRTLSRFEGVDTIPE